MKRILFGILALMLLVTPAMASDFGDLGGEYSYGAGVDVVVYDGKETTFLEEVTAEYRYDRNSGANSVYLVAKVDAYNLVKGMI